MARPRRPGRNRAGHTLSSDVRRFPQPINTNEVLGTHSFAVVAAEVKALAQQTGKATEEIAQNIGAVRETCASVVSTNGQVIAAIQNLLMVTSEISAAVEEQSAATLGISIGAQSAVDSSRVIAANINNLNGQANATYTASNSVLEATGHLFNHTRDVRDNVEKFLKYVRSS
jgi:methyl-accepting chemotaxis protein